EQLFTFKTNLTPEAYPNLEKANLFYDQLTAKLEALPGVASVAAISYVPLSGESNFIAAAPAAEPIQPPTAESPPPVAWRVVRGPYFSTVGSTLLRGRSFNNADQADSVPVVVID